MKAIVYSVSTLLLVGTISACNQPKQPNANGTELASPSPTDETSTDVPTSTPIASLNVEEFTVDDLFSNGGGGCGMSLWRQESNAQAGFIFFNGMQANSMLMKINGEFVKFNRTSASGEEFYGQSLAQTFVNPDGNIEVDVEVQLGEPGEIESVAIKEGMITVQEGAQEKTIPVVGDAGC